MKALRLIISAVLAAGVTLGLLFLMYSLIQADFKEPEEAETKKIADFLMPEREISTQFEAVKPKQPDEPDEPPPDAPEPEFDTPDLNPDAVAMNAPKIDTSLKVGGIGGFGSDGEYLPIVKVQPQYPRRALSRGIEGYVIVEFTVTKNGSVKDPVVVEADPQNVFDKAAMKAALKFKYKPRVIDGEAVDVPGVQNKISFNIAK